ncbi:MAG: hypothetical protein K1X79_08060 [Oligoflexia bacterium]|nr:hypothetical protein [Oligoflexia bacterium]
MKQFLLLTLCSLIAASPSFAQPCSDLIRECFAYTKVERTACFYASAKHSFCAGSSLGRLALKRWEMSPEQDPGLAEAPALLGPRLIDPPCIDRFDTQFSAALSEGTPALKAINSLDQVLTSCTKATAEGLMRP